MATSQTRRTVSMSGSTYRRFALYAERAGESMSLLIERHILDLCAGIADPSPPAPKAAPAKVPDPPAAPRSWCGRCGSSFAHRLVPEHSCVRRARPSAKDKATQGAIVKSIRSRADRMADDARNLRRTVLSVPESERVGRPARVKAQLVTRPKMITEGF